MAHSNPAIQQLLEQRYYLRDKSGNLLEDDPSQMYRRVAREVASAEMGYVDNPSIIQRYENDFYSLMNSGKFLPNTPLLANAGKKGQAYAACYCMYIPDSMEGIFQVLKDTALVFKTGGGMGLDFSQIREKGALVKTTGFRASGPVSFMRVYNSMCEAVKQSGIRRGAMMATLRVDHPDIEEFISCKDDGVSLTNFNISVLITDEFMDAVIKDRDFGLVPPKGHVTFVNARELFKKICKSAWKTGEPGVVFIDTINDKHPFDSPDYEIKGTNACSELPLLHGESCVLGAINLSKYVKLNNKNYVFDYEELKKDIPLAVRFLDNTIDITSHPTPAIEKATLKTRKIGLGIMGWADLLLKLEVSYNSDKAIKVAEDIMEVFYDSTREASELLAEEKGAFPAFKDSTLIAPRRNAGITTIAPTGSTSRICGCSSGIEPIFSWETLHKLVGLEYQDRHWILDLYEKLPDFAVSAEEVSPEYHLKHQIEFQNWIDSSISKTINLPFTATEKDIEEIYTAAWENGCKGITVYRDGSRTDQPLNKITTVDSTSQPTKETYEGIPTKVDSVSYPTASEDRTISRTLIMNPPKIDSQETSPQNTQKYRNRGQVSAGVTYKLDTTKGKMYVTINYDKDQIEPVEVFVRLGHSASAREHELAEWCGRLLSLCLKYNVPIENIKKQSTKVFGDASFIYNQRFFTSIPQLIGYLLEVTYKEALALAGLEINDTQISWDKEPPKGEHCYQCGSDSVRRESGCKICSNCGYEECS